MYGMVNNALREMVSQLGADVWAELARGLGLAESGFLSLDAYPDELTFQLAAAAATAFGQPLPEFLERFGRYWIGFALRSAYGPLLHAPRSLPESLESLDGMHKRIARTLTHLRAPSFSFRRTDTGGTLTYRSEREGLAPFVVGLLHGLAEMHGIELRVTHTLQRAAGGHDEFELAF